MYTGRVVSAAAVLLAAFLSGPAVVRGACAGPPQLAAALKAHPTTDNAIALGNWFAAHQQFACAAETFHTGLAHDANSAELHYLYALALIAQKQIPEAIPELQKSIQLESDVIKPHLVLASLYASAGKQVEAAQEWQKALAIDPQNEQAMDGLTALLTEHEDYQDVATILSSARQLNEKLTIRLSQALGLMNQLDKANAVLAQALKANPHSVALARAQSVVLIHLHNPDAAIAVLQKAVREHPSDLAAATDLFQLYVLIGHLKEAAAMKDRLLAAKPHDRDILYESGIIERSAGNYEAAKKLMEESVAIDPDFFYSRYNLGTLLVILHQWPEAKENLEKAISMGVIEPQAHFELAKALNALGEHEQAQQELKAYQTLKTNQETSLEAGVALAQGDKAMEAGHLDEAIIHYRQAIQTLPDTAYYHYKLSLALHKSGDAAGEKKELEEAIRLDPKLSTAQGALGYLLSREGDSDGAVEHFRKAVESTPQWTEAWINLAAELAVSARYAEARQAVATALQLDPQNERARKLSDQLAQDPNAQQARP
jgi:tetratricopeptide (TPR) repeat protein